ncbi:cell death abnormality protein 1-like [Saccostrea echinata]|uniref:cell death abnormality protein 1-like n=1 Tax=Saccostrea echinata TaxID=191078 RepID=UPI002A83A6B8|nr:cell death abnormality protein 1-like [Saccostrea echinata]
MRRVQNGFFGPNCSSPCRYPNYGKNCQEKCKCAQEFCDIADGCRNSSECKMGFFGPNCSSPCRYPNYGKNCQAECNCTREFCDIADGCRNSSNFLVMEKVVNLSIAVLRQFVIILLDVNWPQKFPKFLLNGTQQHKERDSL